MDAEFLTLPYSNLADVVLNKAQEAGASYVDFRFERLRTQRIRLRDLAVETLTDITDIGYAVRLIYKNSWGFAASSELGNVAAINTVSQAIANAQAAALLNKEPVELAKEPKHVASFISAYRTNPFNIPVQDKIERFRSLNKKLLAAKNINFVNSYLDQVQENKYFANSQGSRLTQQRVRLQGNLEATSIDAKSGKFETMRTNAAPVARGWEYFKPKGTYKIDSEAEQLPGLLAEKMAAPSVKPGRYDLVIDPTNLWLTIHESVGHATELDRALGYEANYAGTSFATPKQLNKLQYGSKLMNITGDRVTEHGLATTGYDDEGVQAQQFNIVKNGRLVGYQLNRQMANKFKLRRSNGCTYSDSFSHVPLQRMPNVSLQPAKADTKTKDLIKNVDDGIYIVGDKSWSIDMQRYNFQFTGQRFFQIKNGKLAGQLKDVAYQANTLSFWNSLDALGGKSTYVLGGAFNCGKGQPGQIAPVSHGCPSAVFRSVNILNTTAEGAQ